MSAHMRLQGFLQRKVSNKQRMSDLAVTDKFLSNDQIFIRSVAPVLDLLANIYHVYIL
jgi:hypothetical protein